jgi:hypothetical protein
MGLWIWCGNENAVFKGGWEKFANTEKGVVGPVKHKSHVNGFFLHWGCCAS